MHSQRYKAPDIPKSRVSSEKSAPQKAEELKNRVVNAIVGVDDGVQSFVRNRLLQLNDDGGMLPEGAALGTVREILGGTVFAQRPGGPTNTAYRMNDTKGGHAAAAAGRALQAGGLTAAGVGLYNLGNNMFGGAADQQEDGQIRL